MKYFVLLIFLMYGTGFRSPSYAHSTSIPSKDNRTTLYWNPYVTLTTQNTPMTLSFYTADQVGTYRVVIEGITNNGHTVHAEAVLSVNE